MYNWMIFNLIVWSSAHPALQEQGAGDSWVAGTGRQPAEAAGEQLGAPAHQDGGAEEAMTMSRDPKGRSGLYVPPDGPGPFPLLLRRPGLERTPASLAAAGQASQHPTPSTLGYLASSIRRLKTQYPALCPRRPSTRSYLRAPLLSRAGLCEPYYLSKRWFDPSFYVLICKVCTFSGSHCGNNSELLATCGQDDEEISIVRWGPNPTDKI